MFKIGTLSDWFGKGLLEGIRESQRCGATGVQIYAWNEFDPTNLKQDLVRQVIDVAAECGQEIVALCGELGGHGLEIAADNPGKIDYLKRVTDLALELDCRIITTHIGIIPADTGSEKYRIMREASSVIGTYAAERGVTIAIETGPEPMVRLKEFINACNAGAHHGSGIGINYDPGNLVMVTRDDEIAGVKTGGNAIVHTHAKDGIMNHYAGPEEVYALFAKGGIEAISKVSEWFTETPLGEGSVRWLQYLNALREIGYNGYLTIEREVKDNAADDIRTAVIFLKEIIKQMEGGK
jgi:sugar phosphate isomerase/epimerase